MKERTEAYRRLCDEYKYFCLMSKDEEFDKLRRSELIGKITLAAEYKLITLEEWETLFDKIYQTASGA